MLPRNHQSRSAQHCQSACLCVVFLVLTSMLVGRCSAQESSKPSQPRNSNESGQINVNWLYGAYVPGDVEMKPLTNGERMRLYIRQTFTTPGIYVKTTLFAMHDQVVNSPPEWDGGASGFAKRALSRQGQFIIQNSLAAAGNAVVGWEPRYDRCRCKGFWSRTQHAVKRSFVTYDRTGKKLRPQVMPYAAAFGAGAITSVWQPGHPNAIVRGYQNAITQIGVGIGTNWLSEFAPQIFGVFHRKHKQAD